MPIQAIPTNHTESNMLIVAHEDDDILFINRDLTAALAANEAVTTVFVTAGDAGRNGAYWQGREDGARAAYASLTGETEWINTTANIVIGCTSFQIATSYLADRPEVRLYFLRVADGYEGGGTAAYDGESLQKLWNGEIPSMHSVDGENTYSRADLTGILTTLMEMHEADNILTLDFASAYSRAQDHSDHRHAARFATLASQNYEAEHNIEGYVTYQTDDLPINLFDEGLRAQYFAAFEAYAAHDPAVWGANPHVIGEIYFRWMQGEYRVSEIMDVWSLDFNRSSGWRTELHVRQLADTDGDGRADIVGFGGLSVLNAAAEDNLFGLGQTWFSGFTIGQGWRIDRHVREVADVNGDGMADIVAFDDNGVRVARSTGTGFVETTRWSADFGYNDDWRTGTDVRELADINGDGRADIVGFRDNQVVVSLSNGAGFDAARTWMYGISFNNGGDPTRHLRTTGDINGDGRDDVVVFGEFRTWIATAADGRFNRNGGSADFGYRDGWRLDRHERMVADVNGDGRDDLIGFGDDGVYVALSNGRSFGRVTLWSDNFGYSDGWRVDLHERLVADVNGDGMADIVAFGDDVVRVALSNGSGFEAPGYPDEFLL